MHAITRHRILTSVSALTVSTAVLAAALVAPPAFATDAGTTTQQAIEALADRGLLHANGRDSDGSGNVAPSRGLVITSDNAPQVSMRPVTAALGTTVPSISAVTYDATGFTYVLTGAGTAGNAGYSVITDSTAPTEFRYEFSAGGAAAVLEEENGTIVVKDSAGTIVNMLGDAWADDAAGASVKTWYTIEGSTVVQHVEHAGASYPVVADPRLACNGVFCTIEYRRSETKTLTNWGGAASSLITGGCTLLAGAVGAFLCGLAGSVVTATASTALSQKKCFGMRAFIYNPVISAHPVVVSCYA